MSENGNHMFRDLMTEQEVIDYLRIPEISKAKNHRNVIENLKRVRDFPTIHICNKTLFPLEAVQKWVRDHTK